MEDAAHLLFADAGYNPSQFILWDAGCKTQRGPCATGNSLPRSVRNSRAIKKLQLLQGGVPQDFQQVCGPIGTFGVIAEAPAVLKRGRWGYTTPMLSNVVQETAMTKRYKKLNIRKKTMASNELAKHLNQICKMRHSSKSASLKLVQLAPRSFCHAVDGI